MAGRYFASTKDSEELIVDILNKQEVLADDEPVRIERIKNGLYDIHSAEETHRVLIVKRDPGVTRVMINRLWHHLTGREM